MTGGEAYVLDPQGWLATRLNLSTVELARPDADHLVELRWLVERHRELTGSQRAAKLLHDWDAAAAVAWRVVPVDGVGRVSAQRAGRVRASA